MKRGIFLSIIVLFSTHLLLAQGKIEQAFKENNAMALSNFFSSNVELSIEDEENIYSKSQAVRVIDQFFKDYPCAVFEVKHESKANKNTNNKFIIGKYISNKRNFRTHFLIHQVEDKAQIIEIRIESEDQ